MDRLGGLWVVVVAALVWLATAVYASSNALVGLFDGMVLFLGGPCITVSWVGCSLLWADRFTSPRSAGWWVLVPMAGILGCFTLATHWPLAMRIWLSESALRSDAENFGQDSEFFEHPKRIGLFQVRSVYRQGTAVIFSTDSMFLELGGVAYAPDGPPPRGEGPWLDFSRIYGPWYRCRIPD